MSIFKPRNQDDYINQIYGGQAPDMSYYSQLGSQKREREEEEKARKYLQQQEEQEATRRIREFQQELEKKEIEKAQAAEKEKEGNALLDLNKELSLPIASTSNSKGLSSSIPTKSKKKKDEGGFLNFLEKANKEMTRGAGRVFNAATLGLFENKLKENDTTGAFDERESGGLGGKITDVGYDLAGYAVPGTGLAKGARALGKGAKQLPKVGKEATKAERRSRNFRQAGEYAKEGAMVGGAMSTAMAGTHELNNPGERSLGDHAKNIALDTTLGAVLDPAIMGGIGALSRLRPRNRYNVESPSLEEIMPRMDTYDPAQTTRMARGEAGIDSPLDTGSRMDSMNDLLDIQSNRQQMTRIDELLDTRAREFEANKPGEIEQLRGQQEGLRQEYEEMRKAFVQKGREPYSNENEIAAAVSKWENVKEMRKQWDNIRSSFDKFRVPKGFEEEYGGLFPRSMLNQDPTNQYEVFNAARDHGFKSDHEGVLEFGHYLRSLQKSKTTRRMDLVPDAETPEADLLKIDEINAQTFPETEDARAMQQVIDSYDTQVDNVQGRRFEDTGEYQSTQGIKQTLLDDIDRLQPRRERGNPIQDIADLDTMFSGRGVAQEAYHTDTTSPNYNMFDMNKKDTSTSITGKTNDWNTKWSDDLSPAKKIADILNGKGESKFSNLYQNLRLNRGATGAAHHDIANGIEPYLTEFGKHNNLADGFNYVALLRARDIKAIRPDYKVQNNLSEEAIEKGIRQFETNNPEVKEFATRIKHHMDKMLEMSRDEGIISAKTFEKLQTENPNYFPFYRNKDVEGASIDMENMIGRNPIKELSEQGSAEANIDPITALTKYTVDTYQAAFRNRALREVRHLDGQKINGKTVAKRLDDVNRKDYNKSNIIKFKEHGQDVEYYVNDDIKRSIDNMDSFFEPDDVLNFAAKMTKFMRQSVTANPVFATVSHPRDVFQAWETGEMSLVRDYIPALIDTMTKGKTFKKYGKESFYDLFAKEGGLMGNVTSQDRQPFLAMQKLSNRLNKDRGVTEIGADKVKETTAGVLERLRNYSEGLDNTLKVANFRGSLRKLEKQGKTREQATRQAAYEGRDTMDWAKSGENLRTLNRYFAFMNSTMRGKERQISALKNNPVSTTLKMFGGAGVTSILAKQALDTYATDTQRQIINEVEPWERQTYWLFPSPFSEDGVISIKKPFESAVLMSTPIEMMLNDQDELGNDVNEELGEWVKRAFGFEFGLNPAQPLIEVGLGRDGFTGRDIVPMAEQNLPASEQRDVTTSGLAGGLADLVGSIPYMEDTKMASPRNWQHLLEGYSPVFGENIMEGADRLAELAGLRENERPAGTRRLDHLNPFMKKTDQLQSPLIGNAHESTDELQGMKKQMQEDGQAFPFHNAYGANRQVSDRDSEFAKTIRMIDNDPNLSREEKGYLREQVIQERNINVRNADRIGLYDTDEGNLANLERRYQGLERGQNKDDIKTQLAAQLTQAGVPEYAVQEVMSLAQERQLSDEQLANALRQLLERYR